jgi:hypothetical protein
LLGQRFPHVMNPAPARLVSIICAAAVASAIAVVANVFGLPLLPSVVGGAAVGGAIYEPIRDRLLGIAARA